MLPDIPNQSFIVSVKYLPLSLGQKMVLAHPTYGLMVKSLVAIDSNGMLWFEGLSAESVSSQQIGAVDRKQVLGHVLWVTKPKKIYGMYG